MLNTCDYFFCVLQIEDSLYLIVSVTCVSHRMFGNKVAYKQGGESPKHVSRRVASLTGVCIQIAVFPHPCRQGVFHLHTHTPPTPNVLTQRWSVHSLISFSVWENLILRGVCYLVKQLPFTEQFSRLWTCDLCNSSSGVLTQGPPHALLLSHLP